MTVDELSSYLRTNWQKLREDLLAGRYQPSPVLEKLIPKSGGGKRKLGIPTVLDRFIQQALLCVLQPRFDPSFSQHSYGFRAGRSAHQAAKAARRSFQEGRRVVVDVDLSKFFDRVNHDALRASGQTSRLWQGPENDEGASASDYSAQPRAESRPNRSRSSELSDRLEELLSAGSNAQDICEFGQMDPSSPTGDPAQAVETR